MLDIQKILAQELSLASIQIKNALELFLEGATVPFIAQYRKERTGEMNEIQLRDLFDRFSYLSELEDRKKTILQSIEEQGKLTDELRIKIEECLQKAELEDLYLPYKPKKRTRATIAREKGLEPLAEFIKENNSPEARQVLLEKEAEKYLSEEKGVATIEEALHGASDIIAEETSEKADHRQHIRDFMMAEGMFVSRVKDEFPVGTTKYEMYRDFKVKVSEIKPHNMLALRRGETEGVLWFEVECDEQRIIDYLAEKEIHAGAENVVEFLKETVRESYDRLMKTTLIGEVRLEKKSYSDAESIKTFGDNLRELLLSSPAGMKPTLGIDPGFRTGCKVAAISDTGKFLEYTPIFPHHSEAQRKEAAKSVLEFIEKYKIELIAIGNGTASRETDEFMNEVLDSMKTKNKPIKVIVNESGASVYSASPIAIDEFPDLDVTVRGAISIARRLQDPLAELVKIDPKSIGVGQYQHDVDQKLLKTKLGETVESCVNFVGVDLNLASKELLSYVSGINVGVAKNIIQYRNDHGAFKNREELRVVPKLGPKAFEQAAGFLRIRDGENPLDNTAVHPESYTIVEKIAGDLKIPLEKITHASDKIKSIDLKNYITDSIGEPTLRDILAELEKPGRDPRQEFRYATFKEGIKEIKDLAPGMELEGVVTNVANFGAFVDIGVHQDGLVHVSQMADRYTADPKQIVKVGQVVKVKVLEVNEQLKRISLTMKISPTPQPVQKPAGTPKEKKKEKEPTIDDLINKFKNR